MSTDIDSFDLFPNGQDMLEEVNEERYREAVKLTKERKRKRKAVELPAILESAKKTQLEVGSAETIAEEELQMQEDYVQLLDDGSTENKEEEEVFTSEFLDRIDPG